MRHHYGANKGEPAKSVEITGIWLRREGDYAVVLFERDGKWYEACRENLDGPFSHIVEPAGMLAAKVDQL